MTFDYLCNMKRKTIWTISIIIGATFMVLLYLQMHNAKILVDMRRQELDENVTLSLNQAAHEMEQIETRRYLESVAKTHKNELDSASAATAAPGSVGIDMMDSSNWVHMKQTSIQRIPMLPMTLRRSGPISQEDRNFLEMVKNAYVYQQGVLDEVIFTLLYNASQEDLNQRLDMVKLGTCIREWLKRNGVDMPFHYVVYGANDEELFRCSDYDEKGEEDFYQQTLFPTETGNAGYVRLHFPDMDDYMRGITHDILPMLIFTLVLFCTFMLTIWLIVRQKHISEMKNDFVHNMTHEFKTPLSSISLAAQMLTDKSVNKSPAMYDSLAGIINTETKRLRFQVEKVLQMSLFEHDNIAFKLNELDANDMIETVVNTFSLKVTQNGGTLDTRLEAYNPFVMVDEMHMTNVVFNLLDNAIKYRDIKKDLHLVITTSNQGKNLIITVADNGIGIQKSDLKRIFEKFYRVHTGDKHDVKGFGLGLAYVHKIIALHHGTIKAESELGQGTKFIITLPNSEAEE